MLPPAPPIDSRCCFRSPQTDRYRHFSRLAVADLRRRLGSVVLARRGDVFEWGLWNLFLTRLNDWRKPAEHPFRSPARAQFWFEYRAVAWSVRLFVAVLVPFMAMIFAREDFERVHRSRTGLEARVAKDRIGSPAAGFSPEFFVALLNSNF